MAPGRAMLHPCAGCLLGVAGGEPGSLCRLRPHLLGCYRHCSGLAFCDGSAAGAFMPTKAFPLMRLWRPSNMTFLNGWTTQVGKCTCFTCLWKKRRSTARLASAFLAAVPSGRTRVEPIVFSAKWRFLVGVPHAVHDCWCPLCAGVLDRECHHAATYVCWRMLCGTCLYVPFAWLGWAGFHPEKERLG